jgi:hypothetical protein
MNLSSILRSFIVALCCAPILLAWSLPALSEDVVAGRAGEPAKSQSKLPPPRTLLCDSLGQFCFQALADELRRQTAPKAPTELQ